jgi:N-acetylglutamate synthase-like GNAT family acetyltransferase
MSFQIREARPSDNAALTELARQVTFSNGVRVFCHDRSPDYFARIALLPRSRCFVGELDRRVVAVGSVSLCEVELAGRLLTAGYVFDAKVAPGHRGQGFGEALYRHRERHIADQGGTLVYKILQRRLGEPIPKEQKWGFRYGGLLDWYSLFPLLPERQDARLEVRAARPEDLEAIAALLARDHGQALLAPRFTAESLCSYFNPHFSLADFLVAVEGGRVRAAVAPVDASRSKRLIITAAPVHHRVVASLSRALSRLAGYPPPPAIGEPLRAQLLRFPAGDPDSLLHLLRACLNRARQQAIQFLFLGVDPLSPQSALPRRFLARGLNLLRLYVKTLSGLPDPPGPAVESLFERQVKYVDPLIV